MQTILEEYFNLLQSRITFLKERGLGFGEKLFKITYFFVTSCEEKYSFCKYILQLKKIKTQLQKNSDKYSEELYTCTCHFIVFSFIFHCFITHSTILFHSHRVQASSSAKINGCVHSLYSPRRFIDANGAGCSTES